MFFHCHFERPRRGSREIRKFHCKRTDFSTRLRLGRNDSRYLEQLYKPEFEEAVTLPGTIRMRNNKYSLSCEIVCGHCLLDKPEFEEAVTLPGTIRMRNNKYSLSCEIVCGHCPLDKLEFGDMALESKKSTILIVKIKSCMVCGLVIYLK